MTLFSFLPSYQDLIDPTIFRTDPKLISYLFEIPSENYQLLNSMKMDEILSNYLKLNDLKNIDLQAGCVK